MRGQLCVLGAQAARWQVRRGYGALDPPSIWSPSHLILGAHRVQCGEVQVYACLLPAHLGRRAR